MSFTLAGAFELMRSGDLVNAEKHCRGLIDSPEHRLHAHSLLSRILNLQSRYVEARGHVDIALSIDCNFFPALLEDAALSQQADDFERAEAALVKAIAQQPQNPHLLCELAKTQIALAQLDRASQSLQRALQLAADFPMALFQLGRVCALQNNLEIALKSFLRCTQHNQNWLEAWINVAQVQSRLNQHQAAAQSFVIALRLGPDNIHALQGYATAAMAANLAPQSIVAATKRIAEVEPSALAYCNLAYSYRFTDDFALCHQAYLQAIALDAHFLLGHWGAFQTPHTLIYQDSAQAQVFLDRWEAGLCFFESVDFSQARNQQQVRYLLEHTTNFYLHYHGQNVLTQQIRYAKVLHNIVAAARSALVTTAKPIKQKSKKRVLIVSAHLRRHTVSKLFYHLLTKFDRKLFELVVCHLEDSFDSMTEQWQSQATTFYNGQKSLPEWIEIISSESPDVVIYPEIGMHITVQALASQRFAPLQCMLWGHPITSGMDSIDYFISSELMESDGADSHYSEKLLRLPNLGVDFALPDTLADTQFIVSNLQHTQCIHFIISQTSHKLTPIHDELLVRIALALPNVRFSLTPLLAEAKIEQLAGRLRKRFAADGLDFEQYVQIFGPLKEAQFIALIKTVDVNLDSIGWSGGNSTLEILYHDVPTVTLPAKLMRSRHTAAILNRLQLPELIARDFEHLVELAVKLGSDAEYRQQIRDTIAQRKHCLYNDQQPAAALWSFFESLG